VTISFSRRILLLGIRQLFVYSQFAHIRQFATYHRHTNDSSQVIIMTLITHQAMVIHSKTRRFCWRNMG